MDRTRRPTSADVAARAGVSRATVSYVLNASTRHTIPEPTRRRVRAAAAELGYTPHAAARALRRGDTGLVLIVLVDVPFGANMARLVSDLTLAVSRLGMSAVTWTAGAGQPLRDALTHLAPQLAVVTLPLDATDRTALETAGIPTVGPHADEHPGPPDLEEATGGLQMRHLALHGHRRVGVVASQDPALALFAGGRRAGVVRGALELGLPEPLVALVAADDDAATGPLARTLRAWADLPDPVTAVACYNDLYAALTLRAARRAGLRVPHDVSVMGVDDEPFARFTDPPLTTLRYDFSGLGDALVEQARALLDHEPAPELPQPVLLDVVERASVGPPPSR